MDDFVRDVRVVRDARRVMRANDRGAYQVPQLGQYPHQWNWDSAFAALGWGAIDPKRGWQELRSLLAAQDETGFVAHIAYHREPQRYMPGREWWGANRVGGDGRQISGISNPPVAGMALRKLYEQTGDEQAARELLPKVQRWHDWWMRERVPAGMDEPVVIHPWEPGRDNAVEWDLALERVPTVKREYVRVDTDLVSADQRPPREHYDRYLGLVEFGTEAGWNQRQLAQSGPFRVVDAATSGILASSAEDVAWVADKLGMKDVARRAREQADRITSSMNRRMKPDGSINSIDMVSGRELDNVTVGQTMAVLPRGIERRGVERAAELSTRGSLSSAFGVRSTSRLDPAYEADKYWRGPVWMNTTWLTAEALSRHGMHDESKLLAERMRRFLRTAGMAEYVNPDTGRALGTGNFTWTAALALDLNRSAPLGGVIDGLARLFAR